MTRTPAPADDAHLDLALREAAEQWRLDFEVPPLPLLDSGSPRLDTPAPARQRWTRPVLVAASIIALGAVAAVVISSARPTGQTAGPSLWQGPSLSAAPATSAQEPTPDPVWPVPGLQTLDIQDGTPPPSIRVGGLVLPLSSAESPAYVVTDSDNPYFLSLTPQTNLSPCNGNAVRIYLNRSSTGTITVTEANYHRDVTEPCPAILTFSGPKYGLAPYAIAGQKLVGPGSDVALQQVDLADYRAPRYLPAGYELGSSFSVGAAVGSAIDRVPGSLVRRVLTMHQQPSTKDITLTWQDPAVDSTTAPPPSKSTEVINCATRILRADLTVTACTTSLNPRVAVRTAELQRVVDSIPS